MYNRRDRCVHHINHGQVEPILPINGRFRRVIRRAWTREEPVATKVEEATVGPVARGQEQDEEENGAVYAGSVEEVGADEEEKDEGWRGVGRYEEEGEPTGSRLVSHRTVE